MIVKNAPTDQLYNIITNALKLGETVECIRDDLYNVSEVTSARLMKNGTLKVQLDNPRWVTVRPCDSIVVQVEYRPAQ